jgi:hypothetical protein
MKVGGKKSWLPTKNLSSKSEDFLILNFKKIYIYMANLGLLLFHEKPFVWFEIIFFRSKFGEILPVKETLQVPD